MGGKRPRYFTANEIALHNTIDDIWVSYLGKVYDLTGLCSRYKGDILLKPIIMHAGMNISHWFNAKTGDIRTYVEPMTGCVMPYAPHGRFIHIPPALPSSNWANDFGRPWWKNDSYCIGRLTEKSRFVKIVNTLTCQEQVIECCQEETLEEILQRYLPSNAHAASYTWKYAGVVLDMDKTLTENSIPDEDSLMEKLGLDPEEFMQPLFLYFNDDLTEA